MVAKRILGGLKLLAEFIVWEIRRIIRLIYKSLQGLPYYLFFIFLFSCSLKFYKSPAIAFSFTLFWVIAIHLILNIIKEEWDTFIANKEYKKYMKMRGRK